MKSTKKALLLSMMSMLLCVAMLMGTTFAWFTDSVTSGVNKIVAGNLDIELEYSKDMTAGSWKTVEGTDKLFDDVALWEPGATSVVYLRIINKGTLALKYNLSINIASETEGTNVAGDTFKLSDYIMFGQVEDVTTAYASRESAINAVSANAKIISKGYALPGTMLKDQADKVIALVVYMPETVGNVANYKTGSTTIPVINMGVNLRAGQLNSEKDSFDIDYDKYATHNWTINAAGVWTCDFCATAHTLPGTAGNGGYALVLNADGTPAADPIVLTAGMAATRLGNATIVAGEDNEINYTNNSGVAQTVYIRTENGNMTVNYDAPNDTVHHYGTLGQVNVHSLAQHSYYEHGAVQGSILVSDGHVVIEESAAVTTVKVAPAAVTVGETTNYEMKDVKITVKGEKMPTIIADEESFVNMETGKIVAAIIEQVKGEETTTQSVVVEIKEPTEPGGEKKAEKWVYSGEVATDENGQADINEETNTVIEQPTVVKSASKGLDVGGNGVVTGRGDCDDTELIFADGITAIDEGAFKDDTAITALYIPSSVKTIDVTAFEGCSNLKKIVFEYNDDETAKIDTAAFACCPSLEEVVINGNVSVAQYGFYCDYDNAWTSLDIVFNGNVELFGGTFAQNGTVLGDSTVTFNGDVTIHTEGGNGNYPNATFIFSSIEEIRFAAGKKVIINGNCTNDVNAMKRIVFEGAPAAGSAISANAFAGARGGMEGVYIGCTPAEWEALGLPTHFNGEYWAGGDVIVGLPQN